MNSIRIDDQANQTAPGHVADAGRMRKDYFRQDSRLKSPALATIMSLMPGLGQIYIGYYAQGFLNIVVVASIITILTQDARELTPFLAVFLAFFWLYNIVDASRRATLYNHALEGIGPTELPDIRMSDNRGSLFWGALLIVIGAFALSHTAFGYSLAWLNRWWPAALVIIGLYLIYKSIQARPSLKSN